MVILEKLADDKKHEKLLGLQRVKTDTDEMSLDEDAWNEHIRGSRRGRGTEHQGPWKIMKP